MKGFWIGVFITLALIVFVIWLDPEPSPTLSDCVKSHTYVTIVPIYNGKTTTWIPQPRTVCDEWGDPYPNPAHAKWLARQEKNVRNQSVEVAPTVLPTGTVHPSREP